MSALALDTSWQEERGELPSVNFPRSPPPARLNATQARGVASGVEDLTVCLKLDVFDRAPQANPAAGSHCLVASSGSPVATSKTNF